MTAKADEAQKERVRQKRGGGDGGRAEVEAMIDDRVQQGIRAALLEAGVNRPDISGGAIEHPAGVSGGRVGRSITNRQIASLPSSPGVALNKTWGSRSLGDFASAISPTNIHQFRNDLSSADGSAGGFLVPEFLRADILAESLESSIVRPRAQVVPMASARLGWPTVDSTSNASSVFGGVTMSWTEEGATIGESDAKFARILLDAKKLAGRTDVPNELLQDAPALDVFLGSVLPQAVAWFEDIAFLTGSGAGEPLGVLNATALIAVDKETAQVADTIVWENLLSMYSRMLPASKNRAVWVANLDTFPELGTMALSVGTGGGGIWLNNGIVDSPASILGRPLYFTEKLPTIGDQGDIMFVDFSHYLLGDRQEMRLESSVHAQFTSDQTVFRIIERVDGRPGILSAVTPETGSSTLSPFVTLAERA